MWREPNSRHLGSGIKEQGLANRAKKRPNYGIIKPLVD